MTDGPASSRVGQLQAGVGLKQFAQCRSRCIQCACVDDGQVARRRRHIGRARPQHACLNEGVVSTGGSSLSAVRFGILPQLLPVLLSQVLYAFESNTRSASIIGIVGAGGIGLILSEQIRTLELQQMAFVILLILATVSLIDFCCARIRFSIIGVRAW